MKRVQESEFSIVKTYSRRVKVPILHVHPHSYLIPLPPHIQSLTKTRVVKQTTLQSKPKRFYLLNKNNDKKLIELLYLHYVSSVEIRKKNYRWIKTREQLPEVFELGLWMTSLDYLLNDLPPGGKELKKSET